MIYTRVVTAIRFNSENILCYLYVASSDIRIDIKKKLDTVLMKYKNTKGIYMGRSNYKNENW